MLSWLTNRRAEEVNNRLQQGISLEQAGKLEEAEKIFRDLVNQYPNSKASRFHLGECASKREQQTTSNYSTRNTGSRPVISS